MQVWTFPGSDVTVREFFLGNFKSFHFFSRHGWQNKLTMVFSLSVLQHYTISNVNRVCHLFRSAMIMQWVVCPSSVFKNWSKLPNSEWNADGAAGFTTIWVDRMFEDSCSALAMAAGFTAIWMDRRFEDPCNALAICAGCNEEHGLHSSTVSMYGRAWDTRLV